MSLLSRRSKSTNKAARRKRPSLRPDFELLEDRRLLAPLNFPVTNTSDNGLGSLRQAILDANANPGLDTIDFATGLSGTIVLTSGELQITDDVTIDGPGADRLSVSGNNASRVFEVDAGTTAAISGLTITGGWAAYGGGIVNSGTLSVTNSTLANDSAIGDPVDPVGLANGSASFGGGGIYNSGTLSVTNSTLANDSASVGGGGIYNSGTLSVTNSTLANDSVSYPHNWLVSVGGGIFNDVGTVTVMNSTLANDSAACGGGIANSGTLSVMNSTLANDSAIFNPIVVDAGLGGGIANFGTVTVINSTLVNDSAAFGGGGGLFNRGTATLNNTIVANSPSVGDVANDGTLTGSHNLIEDGSGGLAGTITGDPKLGLIAPNGGPTQTMALLADSPAIDAGSDALAVDDSGNPLTTDQRGPGFPRIVNNTVDIGAYELTVNQASTTTTVASSVYASVSGQGVTFTATVSIVSPGTNAVANPTGTVTFYDNGVSIGTGTLNGAATDTATFTTSTLSTATHPITAAYTSGDTNFNASAVAPSINQVVSKASTTTTVASSVYASVSGQGVTFTATVSIVSPGTNAVANPTGTVTFYDNGVSIGTGTLNGAATDTATFTTSTLSTATHPITAAYTSGDTNFNASTVSPSINQVVNKASTTTSVSTVLTTSLTDNGAVVPFGQPVTLTATVTADAPSTAVPTGTVDFLDGATNLGTGTLNNVGTATFTTSTLAPGVHHSIKAVYSGDGTNFAGSTAALEQISIIIPVAGTGIAGFGGDGGPASQAQLNQPEGVAVDASGNLYIADTDNNRIRKISSNGIITTVAGNGIAGFRGDGGPASQAQLNHPEGVAVDASGNLYIADTGNNRIRKISPDGIITTVAGNGAADFGGDDGPASQAQLNHPEGVAVDASGNLFIADTDNDRIREVSPNGIITTVAGDAGFSGDGGPASQAQLNHPEGVAVDAQGNLYIADTGNNRIRKISPDGIIVTIAGNGTPAILDAPTGIAVGASGNIFIADTGNNRIRVVDPSGSITTLVSANGLNQPAGIAVNRAGGLFISSTGNNQIFQVTTETAMSQGGNALVVEAGMPNLPPPSNTQPSILLVGAQNSSLALIATLVVTSLNGVESSGTASVSPNQAITPSGTGGESAHADDESGNPQGGLSILIPPALRPWVLVLLGTNEALARIRGTIPDLFTSGDGQQGSVELLSRAYQAVLRK